MESSGGTKNHEKMREKKLRRICMFEPKITSIISLVANAKYAKSITNSISGFLSTVLHKGNLSTV